MKRNEKIALLAKLMQGKATEGIKEQLRQSIPPVPVIAIIRAGHKGPEPEDEVWIKEDNRKVSMLYRDLDAYAVRKGNPVIFLFPDNGRD